jgi:hypothetical protein
MPSLGSGLSLGTLNKISGFDFDASAYILANNISNSAPYYATNNNYVEFGGTGYLSVANNANLQAGSTKCLSFSFWFKTPSSMTFPKIIFGKEVEYAVYFNSINSIQFLIGPSSNNSSWVSGTTYTTPSNFIANSWYHLVFVYDGINSRLKAYLNGVQLGSTFSYSGTFGSGTTNPLVFGEKQAQASSSNFVGGLKHFGIWTRELTQTEVTWLYNSGTPLTNNDFGTGNGSALNDSNLRYYYRFDEPYSDFTWYVNQAFANGVGDITSKVGSISSNTSESSILFTNPQKNIDDFVRGIKNLGIWSNIYFVLLRKFQNKLTSPLASLGGLASVTNTANTLNSSLYHDNDGMVFRGGSIATNYVPPSGNASLAVVANGFAWSSGITNRMLLSVDNTINGRKANIYLSTSNLLLEANHGTGMGTKIATNNFTLQFKATGNFFSQYSHDGSNYNLTLNSNSNITASGVGSLVSSPDPITIGERPSSPFPHRGTIAFAYWANTNISSHFSSIYSLYKSTLGLGLGLP